jgi:hypothetical protein
MDKLKIRVDSWAQKVERVRFAGGLLREGVIFFVLSGDSISGLRYAGLHYY